MIWLGVCIAVLAIFIWLSSAIEIGDSEKHDKCYLRLSRNVLERERRRGDVAVQCVACRLEVVIPKFDLGAGAAPIESYCQKERNNGKR